MRGPLGDGRGSRYGEREGMASVTFQNVSKAFSDNVVAVDRLDLEIADREFLVLLGPSGEGKSVLLKIMAGILQPSSGKVNVEGKDLLTLRGKERQNLMWKMGMLFQKNASEQSTDQEPSGA